MSSLPKKHARKRVKKGANAKIALGLLAVTSILAIAVIAPGLAGALRLIDPNPRKAMDKLERALKRLVQQGGAEKIGNGKQRSYRITKKGRAELQRLRFDEYVFPKTKRQKWDGKWRLVCFDIPEQRKYFRHLVQQKLRELGFYRLQDSVFIFPHPCNELVTLVQESLYLRKNIRSMTVEWIDDEQILLSHFRLSR